MAKLVVRQVKSIIGKPQNQRKTVRALGLKRINDTKVLPDRPEIRGMIKKVGHLVVFEEIKTQSAKVKNASEK